MFKTLARGSSAPLSADQLASLTYFLILAQAEAAQTTSHLSLDGSNGSDPVTNPAAITSVPAGSTYFVTTAFWSPQGTTYRTTFFNNNRIISTQSGGVGRVNINGCVERNDGSRTITSQDQNANTDAPAVTAQPFSQTGQCYAPEPASGGG